MAIPNDFLNSLPANDFFSLKPNFICFKNFKQSPFKSEAKNLRDNVREMILRVKRSLRKLEA
jgi:hypothetical protein